VTGHDGGRDIGLRAGGAPDEGGPNGVEPRGVFDRDADLYDRARPGHPPRIFDDLAAAGAPPPASVLEIGPGTGKATVSLAERGHRITAVELGPALDGVARRNLAAFPRVEVVTAVFEEWPLPAEPFDVVFAATSFHWIDPAVRMARSAEALRPGGLLATVSTHHVAGGTDEFFARVQRHYERWDPSAEPGFRQPRAADVPTDDAEVLASAQFEPPVFHRYEWDAVYATAEYLDLLRTYSSTASLPAAARDPLLEAIGRLIDDEFGGAIVKRYLSELRLARRRR
jgi:SAM-dependent methyltransferase